VKGQYERDRLLSIHNSVFQSLLLGQERVLSSRISYRDTKNDVDCPLRDDELEGHNQKELREWMTGIVII